MKRTERFASTTQKNRGGGGAASETAMRTPNHVPKHKHTTLHTALSESTNGGRWPRRGGKKVEELTRHFFSRSTGAPLAGMSKASPTLPQLPLLLRRRAFPPPDEDSIPRAPAPARYPEREREPPNKTPKPLSGMAKGQQRGSPVMVSLDGTWIWLRSNSG
jgi:hypothetical protein